MMRAGPAVLLGSLGLLFAGCASTDADWRERYLEKEMDANDKAAQLSEERNARSAAVAQLEEARNQIAGLQKENDALRGGGGGAAAAAPTDASVSDAADRLRQTTGMDVHVTPDGNIAIVLPSDINFGAGSKELSSAGKKAVDQIARELGGQFAGNTVRIEGHTDGDPIKKSKFTDNFELGAERALTVLRYLVQQHQVPAERLIAASRGETMPVSDNKSDKGKARNRRVEVIILVPHGQTMAK